MVKSIESSDLKFCSQFEEFLQIMTTQTLKRNCKNVFTDSRRLCSLERNIPKIKLSPRDKSGDRPSPSPRLKFFPAEKIKRISGNVLLQPPTTQNVSVIKSQSKHNVGHGDAVSTREKFQMTPNYQKNSSKSQQNLTYFYPIENNKQSEGVLNSQKMVNFNSTGGEIRECSKREATPRPIVSHLPTCRADLNSQREMVREAKEILGEKYQESAKKDHQENIKKDHREIVRKDYQENVKKDYQENVRRGNQENLRKDYQENLRKDCQENVRKEHQENLMGDIQENQKDHHEIVREHQGPIREKQEENYETEQREQCFSNKCETFDSNYEKQPIGGRVAAIHRQSYLKNDSHPQKEFVQKEQKQEFFPQLPSSAPVFHRDSDNLNNLATPSQMENIEKRNQQVNECNTNYQQNTFGQTRFNDFYNQNFYPGMTSPQDLLISLQKYQRFNPNSHFQVNPNHFQENHNFQEKLNNFQEKLNFQEKPNNFQEIHNHYSGNNYHLQVNPNNRRQLNSFSSDFVNRELNQFQGKVESQETVPSGYYTQSNQDRFDANQNMQSVTQKQLKFPDTRQQSKQMDNKVYYFTPQMLKDQELLITTMQQQRFPEDVMKRQFQLLLNEQKKQLVYLESLTEKEEKIVRRDRGNVYKRIDKKDEKPEWMAHITPPRITYCEMEKIKCFEFDVGRAQEKSLDSRQNWMMREDQQRYECQGEDKQKYECQDYQQGYQNQEKCQCHHLYQKNEQHHHPQTWGEHCQNGQVWNEYKNHVPRVKEESLMVHPRSVVQHRQPVVQNQKSLVQNQQSLVQNQQLLVQSQHALAQCQQSIVPHQKPSVPNQNSLSYQQSVPNQKSLLCKQSLVPNQKSLLYQQSVAPYQNSVLPHQKSVVRQNSEVYQKSMVHQKSVIPNENSVVLHQPPLVANQLSLVPYQQSFVPHQQSLAPSQQSAPNQKSSVQNQQSLVHPHGQEQTWIQQQLLMNHQQSNGQQILIPHQTSVPEKHPHVHLENSHPNYQQCSCLNYRYHNTGDQMSSSVLKFDEKHPGDKNLQTDVSSLLQLRYYKDIVQPQQRNNGLQDPDTIKEALETLKNPKSKKGFVTIFLLKQ